jgi:hypothetical protein
MRKSSKLFQKKTSPKENRHYREQDPDFGLRSNRIHDPSSGFSYSDAELYENERAVNPNMSFVPDEPNRDYFDSWADNKFEGRSGKFNDQEIADIVYDVLDRHPDIDVSLVDIEVRDKIVILRGEVETRRLKRLIEDVIYGLPSIKDVQNRIHVRAQDPDRRRISRSLS